MNNTGLFGWIRDGVKQSVLMGVSDAMEVIGTPNDPGQMHPALQSMASSAMPRVAAANLNEPSSPRGNDAPKQRKRLGRSLKDISPAAPTKATS